MFNEWKPVYSVGLPLAICHELNQISPGYRSIVLRRAQGTSFWIRGDIEACRARKAHRSDDCVYPSGRRDIARISETESEDEVRGD